MSRHDREINAGLPTPAELDELLLALGSAAAMPIERHDAMAQFLSGSEGWRDAKAALGGTFATVVGGRVDRSVSERGLTPGKDK